MALEVKKIIPQTVEVFDNEGNSLGMLNEFEFNEIRIQIKEQGLEGCYAMFEGEKIFIDRDGRVNNWPEGFFDLLDDQFTRLFVED